MLGPKQRNRYDRKGQRGNAERHIGEAHQQIIDPATEIPRDDADHRGNQPDGKSCHQTHGHRHPRPMHELAEHIIAIGGGAEGMGRSRRRQAIEPPCLGHHHLIGIIRGQQRRHDGEQDEKGQYDQAGSCVAVLHEQAQGLLQRAQPTESGLGGIGNVAHLYTTRGSSLP